jgi:biotin carboxyl carrier protein
MSKVTAPVTGPVEAPGSGKVSQIHVAEGQAVEEGDVLVSLD